MNITLDCKQQYPPLKEPKMFHFLWRASRWKVFPMCSVSQPHCGKGPNHLPNLLSLSSRRLSPTIGFRQTFCMTVRSPQHKVLSTIEPGPFPSRFVIQISVSYAVTSKVETNTTN